LRFVKFTVIEKRNGWTGIRDVSDSDVFFVSNKNASRKILLVTGYPQIPLDPPKTGV